MSSPLGYPLEPGQQAAPAIATPEEEDHVTARSLRLVEPLPVASDIDQLNELCHDMRQPLASILMLADAALSQASVPAAVRTRLWQLREQAEWLGDLLEYMHQPDGARAADRKSAHDLARIVADVVQAAQATYGGDLCLRLNESKIIVPATAVELRRAIANLLSNATRAAGAGGRVLVELHRIGKQALLTVDDDGPGFGRIRRGAGLGLRIVARSLRSCGGHLEYSRSQMGGARTILVLPTIDS